MPYINKNRIIRGSLIPIQPVYGSCESDMKPEIHPNYKQITVTCGCGNSFVTGSVIAKDLQIEVCSSCHPFYTGKQRVVDTAGRVDKFRKRYGK